MSDSEYQGSHYRSSLFEKPDSRLISDGVTEASTKPSKFNGGLSNIGSFKDSVRGEVIPNTSRYKPVAKLTPQLNDVLSTAHAIAMNQLLSLKHKSEQGPLTDEEVTQFSKLADAVSKLDRTSREREKMRDPNDMTDEELLSLAQKAAEVLTNGKTPGEPI